jgi:putative transposase
VGFHEAKFGKAAAKITKDVEELVAFYDYPAAHWIHLRTTNPSSTFATCATGPRSPRDPAREPQACDGVQAHRVRQSR